MNERLWFKATGTQAHGQTEENLVYEVQKVNPSAFPTPLHVYAFRILLYFLKIVGYK